MILPWEDKPHHVNYNLKCGVTVKADKDTDKDEDCPPECPFFAQNREDDDFCTFVCVKAEECAVWNPNKPIPDTIKGSKTCRGPTVDFCKVPNLDGTDTCKECIGFFSLFEEDGQCYFQHWGKIIFGTMVFVVLIAFVVVWFVDLCLRPNINQREVEKAQRFRSRAKIHMPKADLAPGEARKVWPIDTNLCQRDVAGPGMMLHMNFQAMLIIWPLFIAVCWTIIAFAIEYPALFILGTRRFGTPRHNCILVGWGYDTQQRLMWTKVGFLWVAYASSFLFALLMGVRQLRIYQHIDAEEKTMKDFALELKGSAGFSISGAPNAEKDIQKAVEDGTGLKIVGVSIAWDFQHMEDDIVKFCKEDQAERETELDGSGPLSPIDDPTTEMNVIHKKMYAAEKYLLADPEEEEDGDKVKKITEALKTMTSSSSAYIVFNTEADKDKALEMVNDKALIYKTDDGKEHTLTLVDPNVEPTTVNWQNFGDSSVASMIKRLLWGFGVVYVPALSIWLFCFYIPYAWSIFNFNYDNGAEPPGWMSIVFTMVVVGGNATMYLVCDIVSDMIGFRFKDTKQTCYMILYCFACMFNVFLDMYVTWILAKMIMRGYDFRTYDGTRLTEIRSQTQLFETYAMQRSLAEHTYRYAFPGTMLVPFVLEPIVTVLVPYQLGKLIISRHREIRGNTAEAYLAAFDFDMGRYADILLNVFLGVLIFYFPGGYTWRLFYGMFISHIVIYTFDHWRILNVIPAVKIVSTQVDWWAQVFFGMCVSIIVACLVMKANCQDNGYCMEGPDLVMACSAAFCAHFLVHMLCLVYLVPALGKKIPHKNSDMEYSAVATIEPNTWFSTNPVHCLRSKFVHQHKPHCRFSTPGKEHLLEVNVDIGCYFSDQAAESEEYNAQASYQAMRKATTEGFTRMKSSLTKGQSSSSQ